MHMVNGRAPFAGAGLPVRAKRIVTEWGRDSLDSGMPDARKPHRPKVCVGSGADLLDRFTVGPVLGLKRTSPLATPVYEDTT